MATKKSSNDSRTQALYSLRQLFAASRRQTSQVRRATGFGPVVLWAISEICSGPGLRVGELANRLRIHPSTASNLCRQMREAGLILQKEATRDRRVTGLYPTARGRALIQKTPGAGRSLLAEGILGMTDSEARLLVNALAPLHRQLSAVLRDIDSYVPIAD